jgi:hypothetical protein
MDTKLKLRTDVFYDEDKRFAKLQKEILPFSLEVPGCRNIKNASKLPLALGQNITYIRGLSLVINVP